MGDPECSGPEKAMASHSSILAWKIPWMEKSGGLQFMGLQRVGHDWVTSLSLWHCYEDEVHPIRYATQANKRGIYKGLGLSQGITESPRRIVDPDG